MIFQPSYFSPISQFQQLVNDENIIFEIFDNYQKQTYRNRCNIYSPNGLLSLTIPVLHTKTLHQKTKDVKIENSFSWQKNHFKSLQNSYRSSPYFEFYEDDLAPIYEKSHKFLLDFLFLTQELSFEMLQIDIHFSKTTSYEVDYPKSIDFRNLVDAKSKRIFEIESYKQVFDNKYGFISNLSILDLLFNEGPNAISFLNIT
jgi:hypothetical protein